MRIGVGLPAAIPSVPGRATGDWAAAAERYGFESVGVIDRLVYDNLDPLVALAVAAARTERLELLTTVLNVPWRRNAVVLAKQLASLDRVADGRLTAGLALGGWPQDHDVVGPSGQAAGAPQVKPGIHVITLAVADLDRALAFYRDGLGFDSPGVIGTEFSGDETTPDGAVAMFNLERGLILAVWPRSELAEDAGITPGPARSGEFSIGHAVASREEVDAVLREAETAGATLTGPAHDRPRGIYSGYFRDPDGHLWDILWKPPARPPHDLTC